jgi:broad specificity phosphatase PhoE
MISREYCAERVLLVCHSVVVLCMRYLLEHMTEDQILVIDRANEIANCSVTSYEYDANARPRGTMRLKLFNFVAPLEEAGAPVTSKPDAQVYGK